MKLFTKSDPRADLAAVPTEAQYIYGNASALREIIAEQEARLVTHALGAIPNGNPWTPASYINNMVPVVDARIPAARIALDVLERSAEYKAAKATIEPLLAAVAQLEREEQAAAQALADKQRTL